MDAFIPLSHQRVKQQSSEQNQKQNDPTRHWRILQLDWHCCLSLAVVEVANIQRLRSRSPGNIDNDPWQTDTDTGRAMRQWDSDEMVWVRFVDDPQRIQLRRGAHQVVSNAEEL